jgi:hypothetical protein
MRLEKGFDEELKTYDKMVVRIANRVARPDLDVILDPEDVAQEIRIILWHELRSGLLPADPDHRLRLLYIRLRDRARNYVRACTPPANPGEVESKKRARERAAYPELLWEEHE